jgi:Flp pilus assembly protein TadG
MKRHPSRICRRLRTCAGTSLLEAALILPLVLLVTFGIAEFSMLFCMYLALENGVSQATRYGVTGSQLPNLTRDASIMQTMRDATPVLTLDDSAFTFSHLPEGAVNWQAGPGGPGDIEKVTVDYTWGIITPLLQPLFPNGQVHLQVASAMKNESF